MRATAAQPSDQPTTYVIPLSLHFNQHQVAGNQDNCWHVIEQPQREMD